MPRWAPEYKYSSIIAKNKIYSLLFATLFTGFRKIIYTGYKLMLCNYSETLTHALRYLCATA